MAVSVMLNNHLLKRGISKQGNKRLGKLLPLGRDHQTANKLVDVSRKICPFVTAERHRPVDLTHNKCIKMYLSIQIKSLGSFCYLGKVLRVQI